MKLSSLFWNASCLILRILIKVNLIKFSIRWCVYPGFLIPQDKEGMMLRLNQWKLVPPVAHRSNPEMIDASRRTYCTPRDPPRPSTPSSLFDHSFLWISNNGNGCLLTIHDYDPVISLKTPKSDDKDGGGGNSRTTKLLFIQEIKI